MKAYQVRFNLKRGDFNAEGLTIVNGKDRGTIEIKDFLTFEHARKFLADTLKEHSAGLGFLGDDQSEEYRHASSLVKRMISLDPDHHPYSMVKYEGRLYCLIQYDLGAQWCTLLDEYEKEELARWATEHPVRFPKGEYWCPLADQGEHDVSIFDDIEDSGVCSLIMEDRRTDGSLFNRAMTMWKQHQAWNRHAARPSLNKMRTDSELLRDLLSELPHEHAIRCLEVYGEHATECAEDPDSDIHTELEIIDYAVSGLEDNLWDQRGDPEATPISYYIGLAREMRAIHCAEHHLEGLHLNLQTILERVDPDGTQEVALRQESDETYKTALLALWAPFGGK
jgi:hypothetical protein